MANQEHCFPLLPVYRVFHNTVSLLRYDNAYPGLKGKVSIVVDLKNLSGARLLGCVEPARRAARKRLELHLFITSNSKWSSLPRMTLDK